MFSDKECESTGAGLRRRALPGVCAALAAIPAAAIFAGPAQASERPPAGLHALHATQHSFEVRWRRVAHAAGYGIRVFHAGVLLRQFEIRRDHVRIGNLRPGRAYQVYLRTNAVGRPVAITVLTRRPFTFGQRVAAFSRTLVGDPYVYGAAGPGAFDCSGLTEYVYRRYGHHLPRTADEQYRYLRHVSYPRPGDLVFFLSGGFAYHVGVYEGAGRIVAAATPEQGVVDQRIWTTAVAYGAP